MNNQDINVKAERLKSAKLPARVNVEEFMRRMSEMNSLYGMDMADSSKFATLVLNVNNPVIMSFMKQDQEKQKMIANQIYYLAMLANKKLSADEMSDFMENSAEVLFHYSK